MRSPKDVLALGLAIVRELELNDRGGVLERWLAHHLAELISEANSAVGNAKAVAEQRAVELILKLWMHRRALPEPVDPLGGYRDAIGALSRLMPEADPWKRHRRGESYSDLLHEMFEALSRIVVGGILLTLFKRCRPISEAESKALEHEEILLRTALEHWIQLFDISPQRSEIEIKFGDAHVLATSENQGDSPEVDQDDFTPQHAKRTDVALHSEIAANLELMQTELATLLTRWRRVAPNKIELDEDESSDMGADH